MLERPVVPGGWSPVVSVVGGGWSVRDLDRSRIPGLVIGVNESGLLIERCRAIVTMDRLWTENRWERGPSAAPGRSLRALATPTWARRSAVQNLPRSWPWLKVFECDHQSARFSRSDDVLNGTNSGICALNLAWLWRPRAVYLFGFDLQRGPNGEAYWHEPYEWRPDGATKPGRYRDWTKDFALAAHQFRAAGIAAYNASPRSLLACFDRVTPEEAFACQTA